MSLICRYPTDFYEYKNQATKPFGFDLQALPTSPHPEQQKTEQKTGYMTALFLPENSPFCTICSLSAKWIKVLDLRTLKNTYEAYCCI